MRPPDIALKLTLPLELAIARNAARVKGGKEDDAYIRRRHQQAETNSHDTATQREIDTSGSLAATILEAKRMVWKNL